MRREQTFGVVKDVHYCLGSPSISECLAASPRHLAALVGVRIWGLPYLTVYLTLRCTMVQLDTYTAPFNSLSLVHQCEVTMHKSSKQQSDIN